MSKEEAKHAVIKDTSVVEMLGRASTASPVPLLLPQPGKMGSMDVDAVVSVLLVYWGAVKETFLDAWGGRVEKVA